MDLIPLEEKLGEEEDSWRKSLKMLKDSLQELSSMGYIFDRVWNCWINYIEEVMSKYKVDSVIK